MKPANSSALLLSCCAALLTTLPAVLSGQQDIDGAGLRVFKSRSGETLVVGTLVQAERTRATIVDRGGQRTSYRINEFSAEDQEWIRQKSAERKKFERQRKEINKIVQDMNSMRPSTIRQASRRLRSYGVAAAYIAPLLREYWKSDDPKVRRDTFVTYVQICRPRAVELDSILNDLRTHYGEIAEEIEKDPQDFLAGVVRFEDAALDYLIGVAFQCQLLPADRRSTPIELDSLRGTEANFRRQACRALGQIQHPTSANALLDVLEVAEFPENSQRDEKSIKVILAALGEAGIKNDEVVETLKRFKDEFPDIVQTAMDKLNSFRRAVADVPVRSFRDKQDQLLVKGKLLSIDGDNILIINTRQEQAVYKLQDFSAADQQWIAQQRKAVPDPADAKDKRQPSGLPGIDRS